MCRFESYYRENLIATGKLTPDETPLSTTCVECTAQFKHESGSTKITGNCLKIEELVDELKLFDAF